MPFSPSSCGPMRWSGCCVGADRAATRCYVARGTSISRRRGAGSGAARRGMARWSCCSRVRRWSACSTRCTTGRGCPAASRRSAGVFAVEVLQRARPAARRRCARAPSAPTRRRSPRALYAKETHRRCRDGKVAREFRACATAARISRTSDERGGDVARARARRRAARRGRLAVLAVAGRRPGVARRCGVPLRTAWARMMRRTAPRCRGARCCSRCCRCSCSRPPRPRSRRYYHVLGTDKVGQDVLYQALKSIRTGLVIGTLTTLVMLPFALLLGIIGGLLPRLDRRRHPVRLHDAQLDSRRAADRRRRC